jgi:hypothetical protein
MKYTPKIYFFVVYSRVSNIQQLIEEESWQKASVVRRRKLEVHVYRGINVETPQIESDVCIM